LRQTAFRRVNEQNDAVNHLQNALDFAAEIGVSGRVENIDFIIAVTNRGVFRHNRNAALAFQIHRIHHAVGDGFVVAESAGLFEHRVNQSRFAVVNVRDDSDVSDFFCCYHRYKYCN
jgi:hypothetical protein